MSAQALNANPDTQSEDLLGPRVKYNVLKHPDRILVKQVEVLPGGTLSKKHGGQIPKGSTISTEVKPLLKYISDAFCGGTSQYIHPSNAELGTLTPISPKEYVPEGGVDRTAKTLVYTAGPATLTFDHDPSKYSSITIVGPTELVNVLIDNFPEAFRSAAWGAYDSSGSYIYSLNGGEITGRRGFHVVFAIQNATEIKAFGERLYKHLWLLGYGYIHISRDGKALPRTIFDTKVIEPQQPLFAGGAHCIECEQRRPQPIWNDGDYINASGVPPLTDAEERECQRMIDDAKLSAKPECERNRRDYIKAAVDKLVATQKVSNAQARKIVESRLGGTLTGGDIIYFDEHGLATTSEVLANPTKYDGSTLADPIDGDVAGKAILFINADSGVPIIYSHAHGGGCFFLKHNIDSLLARLDGMSKEQVQEEWLQLLQIADLRSDEMDRYLQTVKGKTGIGLGSLRKAQSEQQRMVAEANKQDLTQDPGLYLANQLLTLRYNNGVSLIKLEGGTYWYYTGTHWAQIKDSVLAGQLQDVAIDQWGRLLGMWAASEKKPSTMSSIVSSALACLGGIVVAEGDPLRLNSPRPSVINCLNGEVWLTDNGPGLRPHSPDSYLTSCSPITYDEEASAPSFDTAMRGILSYSGGKPMPDQDDMVRHVEELLGYTIQTRRNLKVFVIIVGPGDNGKTKIVKLLQLILGTDGIASDRLSGVNEDGNRFATSRLIGKQAIIDDDVDADYLLPDGLLKKIAEEKPLTAEAKFKDAITFISQVVPWLLGNSWPKTRDLSRGMQTRAQVLFLPRSFLKPSECDEAHPDRQRPELWNQVYDNEMAGVLNRLIAGYYRVDKRVGFMPPPSALQAFDMWLTDANIVSRFITEACEKIPANESVCTTSELYTYFATWCEETGVQQCHQPQQNLFKNRLKDIGFRVVHTEIGSSVFGVKIKSKLGKSGVNGINVPGIINAKSESTKAVATFKPVPKARVVIKPKI